MGGNYDFPHTMVTAGGPGHSQALGKVKQYWGASTIEKLSTIEAFSHFRTKNWGAANGPPGTSVSDGPVSATAASS